MVGCGKRVLVVGDSTMSGFVEFYGKNPDCSCINKIHVDIVFSVNELLSLF